MGNLYSAIVEAIVGKNETTTSGSSSTNQTNNVQPPSYSASHSTSFHQHIPTRDFPYGNSASTHQNTSTANSDCRRNHYRPATSKSTPFSYADVAKQNCSNTSSNRVRSSSSKTIISKDFKKGQQFMYSAILRQCRLLDWCYNDSNVMPENKEYQLIKINLGTYEYEHIFDKFAESVSGDIYVSEIIRVENPYLMGQYSIKKLEYKNKGLNVEERVLFHGTLKENVDSICKDNFNWRFHDSNGKNRFGKGVSFTPKSRYANHYCDTDDKVMIVAKVLVSSICGGYSDLIIPDYYNKYYFLRYDTSIKEPIGDVLVKYSDDEFYPAYLVYFSGKMFYPVQGIYR